MRKLLPTDDGSLGVFSRREALRMSAWGVGGLGLADVLRLQAQAKTGAAAKAKSVIMVYLPGGPSHIDMYDPKPGAPTEYRGEFDSIQTKTPGLIVSEHLPLQAQISDKYSVIQGIKWLGRHDAYELLSGRPSASSGAIRSGEKWPVFGSVVSRVRSDAATAPLRLPPYVNLNDLRGGPEHDDPEIPRYMGPHHGPFRPTGPGLANLRLPTEVSTARLDSRRELLARFDRSRRQAEGSPQMRAMDEYQSRAFDMVSSNAVYQALDWEREDARTKEKYDGCLDLLLARRLVEAGVSAITVGLAGFQKGIGAPIFGGGWDTHKNNFPSMRKMLPQYDRALSTLLTDLYERGLDRDTLVVVWGEFGRSPKVGDEAAGLGNAYSTGRGHWWDAGFAIVAGGGLRMGQVVGETDAKAVRHKGKPYKPQNVLATMYRHLGIDPGQAFLDYQGRPVHLLDDRDPIRELI